MAFCMDCQKSTYFYPRSPCGERLLEQLSDPAKMAISIHALLAESDPKNILGLVLREISIHALLAESDKAQTLKIPPLCISIHALLAESDASTTIITTYTASFLSTLSLRRATLHR